MQFSIGTLCIKAIMQGQHGNTTIIEIVQEDFVETPGGNTVVEVLDYTEGVSEAGLIVNVPSGRGIRGQLKLLRVYLIVGVKEFLKNLRRHGDTTQAYEDAVESTVFSLWRRTIGHQCRHGSAVSPSPKAFEE